MPIYCYICDKCGEDIEVFRPVEDRDNAFHCGERLRRVIPKQQGRPVIYEYYSEMADAHFTGPKQKQKVLREKNLEEVG